MAHINIFVAGSTTLSNYRTSLILWANRKNYNYRRKCEDIQIDVYSYEQVDDNQGIYNNVITNDTDITLFIIEGSLGSIAQEELLKAKNAQQKTNRNTCVGIFKHWNVLCNS